MNFISKIYHYLQIVGKDWWWLSKKKFSWSYL